MRVIDPFHELVVMNRLAEPAGFAIDLPYAKADHAENIFGQAIYHPQAHLLLHRDLGVICVLAALRASRDLRWRLVFRDGYRPCEAQAAMCETPIVKANPHWLVEPRLLSPAGKGGHPRAMAVDITAIDTASGQAIDFGTPFDFLSEDQNNNPAHRAYADLSESVKQNRQALEQLMVQAAHDLRLPMLPLPQEWWDFRFPPTMIDAHAPIYDASLPTCLRVMEAAAEPSADEDGYINALCADILARAQAAL